MIRQANKGERSCMRREHRLAYALLRTERWKDEADMDIVSI